MTKKDTNPDDVAAIYQAILDYSETDEFKELAANASYIPDLSDGETVKKTIEDAADMCKAAYEQILCKITAVCSLAENRKSPQRVRIRRADWVGFFL